MLPHVELPQTGVEPVDELAGHLDGALPEPAAGEPARVAAKRSPGGQGDEPFRESLMDTSLYSMGAYFSDQHPDLVDEVISESEAIAAAGLRAYADENDMSLESCFETLLTGLAVRYYNAVAG